MAPGLCPGLPGWASTRKVKPIRIYWNKRYWVAAASAGPYANLHLAQTDNHTSIPPLSFFTGQTPFLPPNQQRQSTGKRALNILWITGLGFLQTECSSWHQLNCFKALNETWCTWRSPPVKDRHTGNTCPKDNTKAAENLNKNWFSTLATVSILYKSISLVVNLSVRLSVRPSVCLSVCSIWCDLHQTAASDATCLSRGIYSNWLTRGRHSMQSAHVAMVSWSTVVLLWQANHLTEALSLMMMTQTSITHMYSCLTASLLGQPGQAGSKKVKLGILDFIRWKRWWDGNGNS